MMERIFTKHSMMLLDVVVCATVTDRNEVLARRRRTHPRHALNMASHVRVYMQSVEAEASSCASDFMRYVRVDAEVGCHN
jgi:hypothetical protein